MEYTKGEWEIDAESPLTVLSKLGAGYSLICDCSNPWQPEERKLANAQLIASAPDLYEALQGLLSAYNVTPEFALVCDYPSYWIEALNAQAKAEGK